MRAMTRRQQVPLKERLTLTIDDAAVLAGFSTGTIYKAMNAGQLIARKQGWRTLILRSDLDVWLQSLPPWPKANENEDCR